MTKYIFENEAGFTSYTKYFEYLRDNLERFDSSVYEIASDVDRYKLSGIKTFHDNRLVAVRYDPCNMQLDIELFSRDVNAIHHLRYINVTSFECQGVGDTEDLIVHEFTLNAGKVRHELEFCSGKNLIVIFESLNLVTE